METVTPPPAVTVSGGTLTLRGPAELLARPTSTEIATELAAVPWRTEFSRMVALSHFQLGYIETRVQLDYYLADLGIRQDFISFALSRGVRVQTNVRPRGRRLR